MNRAQINKWVTDPDSHLNYQERVVVSKPSLLTRLFLGNDLALTRYVGSHGKITMMYAPDLLSPSGVSVVQLDAGQVIAAPTNQIRKEAVQ